MIGVSVFCPCPADDEGAGIGEEMNFLKEDNITSITWIYVSNYNNNHVLFLRIPFT